MEFLKEKNITELETVLQKNINLLNYNKNLINLYEEEKELHKKINKLKKI